MSLASHLESWIAAPWWPPPFLQAAHNWRLPLLMAAAVTGTTAVLSGGANRSWVMLISLNAAIYAGIPFLLALLIFWKSSSKRGSHIAYELVCILMLLAALLPGNWIGGYLARGKVQQAKQAAAAIAHQIEQYQSSKGKLPAGLEELVREGGPLPASPLPIEYQVDAMGAIFELRIEDPTCLWRCYWVYKPERGEWYFVEG